MEPSDNNPVVSFFVFLYHMILDHVVYAVFLAIVMVIGYLLKDLIFFSLHEIEKLYRIPKKWINSKRRKKKLKFYIESRKTKEIILFETQNKIDSLSKADECLVSLQYLYEYHSDVGFKAIFDLFLSESDADVKAAFIHNMSDSLKEKKLLIFNK